MSTDARDPSPPPRRGVPDTLPEPKPPPPPWPLPPLGRRPGRHYAAATPRLLRQVARQAVVFREPRRERERLRARVVHQLLHHAPLEGAGRVDLLLEEDDLLGARRAHELREPRAAAGRGDEAEIALGQPEAGARRRDAHVARERPLETAGDGGALHRGDRDEGRARDGVEDALRLHVERVGGSRVGHALEVSPGAEEARVGGAEDDGDRALGHERRHCGAHAPVVCVCV